MRLVISQLAFTSRWYRRSRLILQIGEALSLTLSLNVLMTEFTRLNGQSVKSRVI